MRKFIVSIVAAIAFLSTGCTVQVGDGGEATETPSASATTETQTPEAAEPESTDEIFLDVVHDEYPFLNDVPDSDLIGLAQDACGMLDAGFTPLDVLDVIASGGATQEVQNAMSFVVGAGVGAYCPEYTDLFLGTSA